MLRFRVGLRLLQIALLLAVSRPVCGAPADYEGKRIAEIYFDPFQQPLTRDQLGLALNLRPGDVYRARLLDEAEQRLYLTGRFDSIEVDARLDERGDVLLTFRTAPRHFVGVVTVEGVPEPPNPAQLVNATKLELGSEYDEKDLPAAKEQLVEALRANGFYLAQVTYEESQRPAAEEIDVRFLVVPGPRSRFTRPVFSGGSEKDEKKLLRKSGWQRWWGLRGWQPFTDARVQQGMEKVRAYYLDRGHLSARVGLEKLEQDPATNLVRPHVSITAGPRIFVRTEGAKVSKGDLRRLIPIYQERTVDGELLAEGKKNLTQFFQTQGYFDASVSIRPVRESDTGEVTVRYDVSRGERSKLVSIAIGGNEYFDKATLLERLEMEPATKIRNRRGRFGPAMLDRDLEAIADLYHSNGFRDAKATARVDRNPRGKENAIGVTITVAEGAQWTVGDLEISGVDLRLLPEIENRLSSTRGQPFSAANILSDRDTILGYYFNNGYPEAEFDYTATPLEGRNQAKVKYTIREGRRNFVRDIIITGLERTDPELVKQRLQFAPQEPLSQGRLVETQRRLYDLGIFAKVDVAVQNPEGRERNKYVIIETEEARKYSLSFGIGAEFGRIGGGTNFDAPAGRSGFSPRALIGLSRLNMFGAGHTAGATARVSNIQQRLLLNYFAPHFRGNDRYSLTFSALGDQSRDIRTFTSQRVEAAMQLTQRVTRPTTVQYRLSWRLVNIPASSLNIDPSLIPIYSQPTRVGLASVGFIQDRRDDPLESTRGIFNTLDFGVSGKALASNTSYTRIVGRNSTYHKVKRDVIFARSVTMGWLNNLRLTPIPLPENFFGGGATTHRGFPDNQAGPRDLTTGFPVGGQTFLFNNLELRFPILGRTVGAVLFHDAGNVYTAASNISFRWRQRDLRDFDYMVQAAGFGLRFRTPIGPLRLDLAYAPNTPRFVGYEGSREDLLNGSGRPNVLQRVSRFQFHFSIGQAF